MDALLETARDVYEGTIDFKGQQLAESLTTYLLSIAGAIAFLAGYIAQDITLALYVLLGGTALAFLLVVPPWPFYNQNPQPWLPARSGSAALQGIQIEVDGKKIR